MGRIELEHVTKVYPDDVRAVDDVSVTIDDGEFMVLVGPSGCGKSTLMRMIAGLEEVSEGTIEIGGRDVTDLPPKRRDVAMVFQNYALYPYLTVAQNLAFPLKVAHVKRRDRDRQMGDVGERLGRTHCLCRKPGQLSREQRQRVAMGWDMEVQPTVFL